MPELPLPVPTPIPIPRVPIPQFFDVIDPLGSALAELERDHWRACLEVVPLDVDIPLEGEATTEDTEAGPQEAVDPIGAIAHGIQDYYDVTYQDSATIPG